MRWPRFCAVGKGCSESFRGLRGLGDGKRKETGFVPRCVLMKEPTKEWKTPSHVRHAIQGGESAAGEGRIRFPFRRPTLSNMFEYPMNISQTWTGRPRPR